MSVYFITGKLGGGKSLCAVGRIRDYLNKGSVVATNLNIKMENLVSTSSREACVYRIPDKPVLADLEAIGIGNTSYDEEKNGLLVLDECGTWFNSRSWADKERQAIINWFLHARKKGWDILFIIQDLSIVDKQARMALAEHVVYCRRLDRLSVPFIGGLFKLLTGSRLKMPQSHLAIVKYGDSQTSLTVDRWLYRGKSLYRAYDTKQIFSENYSDTTYRYLPPYHIKGRYQVLRDGAFFMRMTKIYLKRFSHVALLSAGLVVGLSASTYINSSQLDSIREELAEAKSEPAVVEPVEEESSFFNSVAEYDNDGNLLKPVTFKDRYSAYQIVGYMKTDDRIFYRVTDGDSVETMDSLRSRGLVVRDRGACELLVINPLDRSEFASIYARDCMPEVEGDAVSVPVSLGTSSAVVSEPVIYGPHGQRY